jgi:hypothetical protein
MNMYSSVMSSVALVNNNNNNNDHNHGNNDDNDDNNDDNDNGDNNNGATQWHESSRDHDGMGPISLSLPSLEFLYSLLERLK